MTREKRTIRQVPLPHNRKTAYSNEEETVIYEEQESFTEAPSRDGGISRIFLWGTAVVFLLLLGFAIATGFSGATITVTPKTATIDIDNEFVATTDGGTSALRLETLELTEAAERSIPADTSKQITEKATGKIVIYNTYSESSQRLIKNTRFATPDGLIYRIGESIVVPGFKKNASGKIVPGSLEVAVSADAPGEDYNIGLTDFSIPGFKTDPVRYAAFYARSKTSMTGGVDGIMKTPSDVALVTAEISLQSELQSKILEKARASVPDEFVLYDQALILTYNKLPLQVNGDTARIQETVHATAYLLKRTELERAIASKTMKNQSDLPVTIPELASLQFQLNEKPSTDTATPSIRFSLKGSTKAIWVYDEDKLRVALLGKQRSELASALSSFPTIEKVDLVLRPFWSRSFPTNPKKVTIEEASVPASIPVLDTTIE